MRLLLNEWQDDYNRFRPHSARVIGREAGRCGNSLAKPWADHYSASGPAKEGQVKMAIMKVTAFYILPCAVLIVSAGCIANKTTEASHSGEVKVRVVEAEASETYPKPDAKEAYDGPYPSVENAAPKYPLELLDIGLPPVKVRARIIVDEGGNVSQVIALDPKIQADRFIASVEDALQRWQFAPLVKMEGGSGTTTFIFHGKEEIYEGKATALPFHQDYEFTFTQRDGKGIVSSSVDR